MNQFPATTFIVEAMAMGRPALSAQCHRAPFSGIFNATEMARSIIQLAHDQCRLQQLGEAAQKHILSLCDGPARAADLLTTWLRALTHR